MSDSSGPARLPTDTVTHAPDPTGKPALTQSPGAPPSFPFLGPPTQPGDLGTLGPFRVVRLLGEGGMGFVFRGEDVRLDRPVALKVMKPEIATRPVARDRFLREGRSAASLKSDHVITVYDVGEANGVAYLAMEYLDGWTLEDWLKNRPAPSPVVIVRVAKDSLKGLAAAHEKGMVHRDVKPANLWVEKPVGRIKVLDFGLARGANGSDQMTGTGEIIGTPAYMSPEQARGGALDARSDLFSLGVVLYRMAVGQSPFARGDTLATLTALALEIPPPPPELPADLAAFISRLMAKDPDARPADARAALAELAVIEKRLREQPEKSKSVGQAEVPTPSAPPETFSVAEHFTIDEDSEDDSATTPIPRRRNYGIPVAIVFGLLGAVGALALKGTNKDKTVVESPPTPTPEKKLEDARPPTAPPTRPKTPTAPPAYRNALGMEFVKVPKGTGWLGGSNGKPGEFEVEFKADFYLGKYEVTQAEWKAVTGRNPSHFSRTGRGRDEVVGLPDDELNQFPVELVSWDDCQTFAKQLSEQLKESGWVYRLPTIDEWEYACRGGPLTGRADSGFDFYLDKPSRMLGSDDANFNKAMTRTRKVGSYKPNALGLHDMHGNVGEWTADDNTGKPGDLFGVATRVYRGGSWGLDPNNCRAVNRRGFPRDFRFNDLGLRLARMPANAGAPK